ncbi:hypothetical protein QN277_019778 [Acacia crassicarpa]|uniref:Uncharacterized protein n=1 Tax=Acacia crassicarpa TaxID=499986 RepID=A0AAE1JMJ8_9FABA|nr:hypothetical protein QN277_019778 [Acacia crassicarpa]
MFVKSVDASSYVKSGPKLFELLDNFVEEIGEKNVVQVVTDNGSNYVLAGKLLQAKREHLFWTPCAAHCLDLMLEDIEKIERVTKSIQRGIKLVGFIYNHTLALNTMRKYTSKTELVMGPLVRVLRLVDNEKRPAMEYIYEAMDRAKEAIQKSFNGNEDKYKDIFAIIDRRWDCQLHHPLHAAGHYLNPECFYANPQIDNYAELISGLYKCIDKLSVNDEEVDKIHGQLEKYRRAKGLFGMNAAVRQRNKSAPTLWWKSYGAQVPELRNIAVRVLGLTCSASRCECNWSTFEHIHSKKRSRLEHQRLQDLVFIKYNQGLKERFESRDLIDPIVLNDIDESNEWLVGEVDEGAENEFVFDDDNLTWGEVANVTGANEPITFTRQHTRFRKEAASIPSSSRGIRVEEGDNKEIEDEEEEQIYKLNTSEESEGGEEDLEEMFNDDSD